MMGDGFGDEIGKGLIRWITLLCVVCVGAGYGLSIVLNWFLHHIAIHWK